MTGDIAFTIRIALAILAAYRLSRLLTLEAGPAFIFAKMRTKLADRSELLGMLFGCPLCLGVWVGLALTPFVFIPLGEIALLPLAIAGGQCALQLAMDNTNLDTDNADNADNTNENR